MAIISKIVVGACAFATMIQAAPMRVLTVTDLVTVTTYETINQTATVWQPVNQSPVATTTSSTEEVAATEPPASSTSQAEQAQFAPVPATTSLAIPSTAPAVFAQGAAASSSGTTTDEALAAAALQPGTTFQTSTAAAVRSVTTAAVTTSAPPPAATTTTAVMTTPVAVTTTAAAAGATSSTSSGSSGSSSGGTCEGSGSACSGDVTHWDGGLGACGWNVNTGSDMQIALPVGLMGAQSNGNPYCGRSVTLKDPITGTTVQATVGDKCMGCTGTSIDCTNAVFNAITGGTGDGREGGIQWWFN